MPNQSQSSAANSQLGTWFWVAILGLLVYTQYAGQGGGCTSIISGPAPYVSPAQATFLLLEDATPEGRQKLTGEQLDIIASNDDAGFTKTVEKAGGAVKLLDANQPLGDSVDAWVKLAFAVANKTDLPSIVAAGPRGGIAPQKLPQTVVEAKALAAPLLAK